MFEFLSKLLDYVCLLRSSMGTIILIYLTLKERQISDGYGNIWKSSLHSILLHHFRRGFRLGLWSSYPCILVQTVLTVHQCTCNWKSVIFLCVQFSSFLDWYKSEAFLHNHIFQLLAILIEVTDSCCWWVVGYAEGSLSPSVHIW